MERKSDGSAVFIHEVAFLMTLVHACSIVLTVPRFSSHVAVTV